MSGNFFFQNFFFLDMRSTAHVDGPPMETDPTKTGKRPVQTKPRLGDILHVLISKNHRARGFGGAQLPRGARRFAFAPGFLRNFI